MESTTETMTRSRRTREESGRLKRSVTWGLVLALAASGVWVLFLRGGEPSRRIDLPKPGEISTGAAAPGQSAKSGKVTAAPIETFKVFAPKDPFDPLVQSQSAAPSAGAKSAGGEVSRVGNHAVKLAGIIDSTSVRITVDGSEYLVGLQETFAESFKLLTIGPRCVALLHGDEQLTLC